MGNDWALGLEACNLAVMIGSICATFVPGELAVFAVTVMMPGFGGVFSFFVSCVALAGEGNSTAAGFARKRATGVMVAGLDQLVEVPSVPVWEGAICRHKGKVVRKPLLDRLLEA